VDVPTGGAWLVDVGFGDGFLRPLPLEMGTEVDDPTGAHRLLAGDDPGTVMVERRRADGWERRYRFSSTPVAIDDFVVGCQYHATSADSPFTAGTIASMRQVDGGRLTLAGRKWIVTAADGERDEREVSEEEAHDLLGKELGLEVEGFRPVG
jgi:N-hydroxyarylamine O-acetyltransferase